MTAPRRDGQHLSGFSKWTREEPRIASRLGYAMLDIDFVWHQWLAREDRIGQRTVNHLMLIEEKSRGKDLQMSQRDTMYLIDQAMTDCDKRRLMVRTIRGDKVRIRWWGYHKLRYAGDAPDTSEWITWDKKPVSLDELVAILRFELNPRNLKPLDDRRHHPPKTIVGGLFPGFAQPPVAP
jgi:hypothetical protein